jgi:hypothetical protein
VVKIATFAKPENVMPNALPRQTPDRMTYKLIEINSSDKTDIRRAIRSFKKTIYFVTPFFIFISLVILYRLSLDTSSKFVILITGLVVFIPILFIVVFPIKAIGRYNQLIFQIILTDIDIEIESKFGRLKTNFHDISTTKNEFNFKGKFYPALILTDKSTGHKFVLLSKFFENYTDIVKTIEFKSTGA